MEEPALQFLGRVISCNITRRHQTVVSSSDRLPKHPKACLARDPPHSRLLARNIRLVEEADDLAGDVLAAGLLLVHDTSRGGKDDVAELTGGKELDNPLLELSEADVVAGGDDTALVEAAVELDNDLAGAVVIDLLELADVA